MVEAGTPSPSVNSPPGPVPATAKYPRGGDQTNEVIFGVCNVERSIGPDGDGLGSPQPCLGSGNAVAIEATNPSTSYGRDRSSRFDPADAMILFIGHIQASVRAHGESVRKVQLSQRGRAAIAAEAREACSSYSANETVLRDPPDAVVIGVGDVEAAVCSHSDAFGSIQSSQVWPGLHHH